MSGGWTSSTDGWGKAGWKDSSDDFKKQYSSQDVRSGGNDGYGDAQTNEFYGSGEDPANGACNNCGQDGHFARDCPEERKMTGECFRCGQVGHNKAECPNPRKFKGTCRTCGQEASGCPDRKLICKQCLQEGHETIDCKNAKVTDQSHVADMTVPEAWEMLQKASDERDITDFKEAVAILSKAMPELTYPALERECRKRNFQIYLIAMEKDHGITFTNVNMQGEIEQKFCVSYYLSDKPQRPSMKERWPQTAEENLERLAEAGIPVDRGIPKCNNCNELGHTTTSCEQEKQEIDRPTVQCALCGEAGHRVRDCTQERRSNKPRACKICEAEDHLAKDCPNREKRTCRNCGSEDHVAKECDQPRNPDTIKCRNCEQMGHLSKDCTAPKDWSKVQCRNCEEFGHGAGRCKKPPKVEEIGDGFEAQAFADTEGDFDNGKTDTGKWVKPAKNDTGSGHNDWEVAPTAPIAVTTGGGSVW